MQCLIISCLPVTVCRMCDSTEGSSHLCRSALVASILEQVSHHIQVILLGGHVQRSKSILTAHRQILAGYQSTTGHEKHCWSYSTKHFSKWTHCSQTWYLWWVIQAEQWSRGSPETVRWCQHLAWPGASLLQPDPLGRICEVLCFLSGQMKYIKGKWEQAFAYHNNDDQYKVPHY